MKDRMLDGLVFLIRDALKIKFVHSAGLREVLRIHDGC